MFRLFMLSIACVALISVACKSGNKEVAEIPTTDTTALNATPPVNTDTTTGSANGQTTTSNAPANNTTANAPGKGAATPPLPNVTKAPGAPDENGYYTLPEKKPLYPGGETAFNKYLADNLKYPVAAREANIQGTVFASLLVNEKGKLVDVSIISQPLGYGLEEEVIRVLKIMPQWSPGEFKNHAVKTRLTLPVKYELK